MTSRKIPLAFAILVLAFLSFSSVAAETYKVSASLLYQGKVFAKPTVVVQPGAPARVAVSGTDGYTLTLVLTNLPSNKVKISAKLDSSHGSASPQIITYIGKPVTVTEGEMGLTLDVHRANG